MNKWALSAPENHLHKIWIIEGLLAESKGEYEKAHELLLKGAKKAEELSFVQNAAIAYWFLELLHKAANNETEALKYRKKSKHSFKEWGCNLIYN